MNSKAKPPELPVGDLIDRIAKALPAEVRADYYRELMHCRSLPESDEMLRILRVMQFLTLLMEEVPGRVVIERKRLEQLFGAAVESLERVVRLSEAYQKQLDVRITHLPEALEKPQPGGYRRKDQRESAAVYRNSLAREVRLLGYEITNRRDGKGRDCGFEIRGISDELLAKYSKRSRQRDEAINEFVAKKGRQPTDNEVAVLVRESRADKLIEISTEEVRVRQRERLTPEETRSLAGLRCQGRVSAVTLDSAEPSLRYAEDHVFERVSVSRDHEILAEALRHGRGRISHEELKSMLTLQEASGAILRNGNEIATAGSLQREREMITCINRGVGGFEHLGGSNQFVISDRLQPEQKAVVEFVLNSRDRAVNICGAAGTGKTATLQELRRGLVESGHEVLALAPTMSAVEQLQKGRLFGRDHCRAAPAGPTDSGDTRR